MVINIIIGAEGRIQSIGVHTNTDETKEKAVETANYLRDALLDREVIREQAN